MDVFTLLEYLWSMAVNFGDIEHGWSVLWLVISLLYMITYGSIKSEIYGLFRSYCKEWFCKLGVCKGYVDVPLESKQVYCGEFENWWFSR